MSITLIIHYCGDSREGRRQEYEECLRRNLANGHIQRIINLGLDEVELPAFAQGNPKVISHAINHRMTFRDAFRFANCHLQGPFVGIANLDTFLDDRESDWPMAENLVRERNLVLCRSRIEFENDEKKYLDPAFSCLAFANVQGTWFFVPSVPVENIDFEIGILRRGHPCGAATPRRPRLYTVVGRNQPAARTVSTRPDRLAQGLLDSSTPLDTALKQANHRPQQDRRGRLLLHLGPARLEAMVRHHRHPFPSPRNRSHFHPPDQRTLRTPGRRHESGQPPRFVGQPGFRGGAPALTSYAGGRPDKLSRAAIRPPARLPLRLQPAGRCIEKSIHLEG